MSPRALQLDDAAFWSDPRATRDAVEGQLEAAEFHGLLLDGPAVVPLPDRQTLPLAGWYGLSGRVLELGGPGQRLVILGGSLDTGEVRAGLAFGGAGTASTRRETPDPPGSRPDPDAVFTLSMFDLDARARLDLPWRPGTWSFRVLLRDLASDLVRVKLEGPAPATTPATAATPAPPWPPATANAARWRDVEDAPAIPGRPGLALSADRALVPGEPGARWRVRVAWRLAVRPQERVPRGDDAPPFVDPEADAVVPLTLVVVGTVMPGPWVVPLRVPCYALEGDQGTGVLEVDLLKLGAPKVPQTHFIYAAAGEALGGPVTTALVSPDALPRDRRST